MGEGKHREVRRRSGKHHGFRPIGRCRQRLGPDLLADESWPVSESHHAIRRRPRHFNARQDTLEHAQANGIRLFEALGVSTLEQARAIPARTVLEAAESLPVPPDSGREDDWSMIVNWVPCVDGLFLPDQEERIVEGCKANNVDMLVGNTTNEFIASTEDGKPVHVGQLGNLTLIRKWTASGGTAPYYYHFDVAMPGG